MRFAIALCALFASLPAFADGAAPSDTGVANIPTLEFYGNSLTDTVPQQIEDCQRKLEQTLANLRGSRTLTLVTRRECALRNGRVSGVITFLP
jgi:hypothetical protein